MDRGSTILSVYDKFMEYLNTEDEKLAYELLETVREEESKDYLMMNLALYRWQNTSEQLNVWLDFTKRFIESLENGKELEKKQVYWLDNSKTNLDDRLSNLVMVNIKLQVIDECFKANGKN